MNECCKKKTVRNEEEKKIITNRINRIEGQLTGIKKMIQNDSYCNDVLVQLSAVENSVKSLSNHILENHLYTCVSDDLKRIFLMSGIFKIIPMKEEEKLNG